MPRMKRTYPVLANRSITDRLQTGFRDGPHGKARNEASDRKGASRSRNARETITGLPILPSENRKSELFRLSWACRTRGKRPRRPKTCPIAKLLSHERKEPALHRLVRRRFDGLFRADRKEISGSRADDPRHVRILGASAPDRHAGRYGPGPYRLPPTPSSCWDWTPTTRPSGSAAMGNPSHGASRTAL